MKTYHDAKERLRKVQRKVMRKTFGSVRYLFLLLSLLPPSLAITTPGGELLGRYQVPIGVILFIPPLILAIRLVRHQKRIVKQWLREQAICPKCSYDLTGNVSGICPECGTTIREHKNES